ncbi:MAG: hypothetical protein ABIB46_00375 [bacterium]|nr:hypothetical protein [Nanoarchaeota archaeon]
MKLSRKNLLKILRRKNDGWTTYRIRKITSISVRRINQVWNEYLTLGEIPKINKKNGRPIKPIEIQHSIIFVS